MRPHQKVRRQIFEVGESDAVDRTDEGWKQFDEDKTFNIYF
jgi:hypothetical protein